MSPGALTFPYFTVLTQGQLTVETVILISFLLILDFISFRTKRNVKKSVKLRQNVADTEESRIIQDMNCSNRVMPTLLTQLIVPI